MSHDDKTPGSATAAYSERLHRVIPGGAHTYSRGDDQYPVNAPRILERANLEYTEIFND